MKICDCKADDGMMGDHWGRVLTMERLRTREMEQAFLFSEAARWEAEDRVAGLRLGIEAVGKALGDKQGEVDFLHGVIADLEREKRELISAGRWDGPGMPPVAGSPENLPATGALREG